MRIRAGIRHPRQNKDVQVDFPVVKYSSVGLLDLELTITLRASAASDMTGCDHSENELSPARGWRDSLAPLDTSFDAYEWLDCGF